MIKYDNVFIDLDGPILEGKERHYACYKDIVTEMNGVVIPLEKYWNLKRQRKNHYILQELSQLGNSTDLFMNCWLTRIEEKKYLQLDELKPHIKEALEKIRLFADRVVLVTMRQNKENLFWQLESLGLLPFFDEILVCEGTDKYSKAETIKKYCREINLFVGDTEVDVFTADTLNIDFVGINNGLRNSTIFVGRHSVNELIEYVRENNANGE
ncbi:MAG: HAD hydrolase-like protein [bacterium]|nr:HAD hydrolase-like protein [bacterium]